VSPSGGARDPGSRDPRSGSAGALRTRAGVGIAAVAAIALVLALTGVFGTANHNPDSVAIAGATIAPSPLPTLAPTAPPATPTTRPAPVAPLPTATARPVPTPKAVEPLPGVPSTRLQKAVDAWRTKTGVPGISVAIAWDDGRAWAGVSGRSDVAKREPMTTGTAFAFASVSKTMTAAVVMQLVDEGKVKLDQAASTLLPEYALDKRITVRMLLDHRSSLPDFFANGKIDRALQRDRNATWTPARTWKYVPKSRPTPGTIYDYSNTNYLLLGELVENVTGNSLAVEVRNRILDPLQLTTAWYQAEEKPLAKMARGYRISGAGRYAVAKPVAKVSDIMPFRSVVTAAGGAGSIAGTATDAARWMQAYGSGEILGPTMFRAMVADAKYTKAMRAVVTYGLGVQVITIQGQKTLGHSGRYLGFQNSVRYLRDPGISIAILTNQSQYDPATLMRTLIRIVAPKG
jgi:D-alanyl-D-alanine carboxypeptidase